MSDQSSEPQDHAALDAEFIDQRAVAPSARSSPDLPEREGNGLSQRLDSAPWTHPPSNTPAPMIGPTSARHAISSCRDRPDG